MTQQELLLLLHQYTPWEEFNMQNRFSRRNESALQEYMEHPMNQEAKAVGLHRHSFPDISHDIYSEDFFFVDDKNTDILLIQHDRYTPPVMHRHDFYELLYVYEGEFTQKIDTTDFIMRTGDFCLIPPRIYHTLDVNNYSIVLNILIKTSTFHDIFLNVLHGNNILSDFFLGNTYSKNINDFIIFHTNGDLKIQGIILDMCLETLNKECYYIQLLHTNLLLLFGLLLRGYEDTCVLPTIKKKRDSLDFSILKYVEDHYQSLTLQELAAKFHYSPQYISHHIKRLTGLSFTEYLMQKRMQEAASLLVNTNIKVKSVSESVGYRNQEHFIRLFRKYYGISPSMYRAKPCSRS